MFVILSGKVHGITEVEGEADPRIRNIVTGDTINVPAGIGIWHLCMETCIAESVRKNGGCLDRW